MGQAVTKIIRLDIIECAACDISFGAPETLISKLRVNGNTFYCPMGHHNYYGQSENDRLRKKLDEQVRQSTLLADRAKKAQIAEQKAVTELKRLTKRSNAGVCHCCNRTFQQLAKHMKSKHPDVPNP